MISNKDIQHGSIDVNTQGGLNKLINSTKSIDNDVIDDVIDDVQYKNIDKYILGGLNELIQSSETDSIESKSSYFDAFKIKLKPAVIKSALKPIAVTNKYRNYLNQDDSIEGNTYGPVDAIGMDSGLTGDIGTGAGDTGWGADGYAVHGFGEAINRSSNAFIKFINRLKSKNIDPKLMKVVADGYKSIYNNIEHQSSVILCGFQPSLSDYMTFNMEAFVLALNNYAGEIVSLYVGEINGMEPVSVIKQWYSHIGVDEDVIANILFIEKATEKLDESLLDIPFNTPQHNIPMTADKDVLGALDLTITSHNELYIESDSDIMELIEPMTNPILIGCADLYFLPDLMINLAKQDKKFQIDNNFMFLT